MSNLEYVQTSEMTREEVQQWEQSVGAAVLEMDNGGVIELQVAHNSSADRTGKDLGDKTYGLFIAACNDLGENELHWILSDRDQIRKLRNFLNDYLENNHS